MIDVQGKLANFFSRLCTPSEVREARMAEQLRGDGLSRPYKSVRQIKQECNGTTAGFIPPAKKNTKPFFYISKSRIFRRRVGRLIYGKEGNDIFL